MWNKKCNHRNFWEIYKIINFNKTFCEKNWREFICPNCKKTCVLKWKWYNKMQKSWLKKYLTYLLWSLPAIILIYLTLFQMISYLSAILLITVFHFGAMYFILKSNRLIIKEK